MSAYLGQNLNQATKTSDHGLEHEPFYHQTTKAYGVYLGVKHVEDQVLKECGVDVGT